MELGLPGGCQARPLTQPFLVGLEGGLKLGLGPDTGDAKKSS